MTQAQTAIAQAHRTLCATHAYLAPDIALCDAQIAPLMAMQGRGGEGGVLSCQPQAAQPVSDRLLNVIQ
jgi:hypothetical protein